MPSHRTVIIAAMATVAASILPLAGASADGRSGGGRIGDGYIDDLQKNPRLIEPGAQNDPVRYRIGAPYEGYEDRQAARAGYYGSAGGYDAPVQRRGRVTVEPYRR